MSFVVLISVYMITRGLVHKHNQDKLDGDIRAIGLRQISLIREPRFWDDLENIYDFLFETNYKRDQLMIFAFDKEFKLIRSTNKLPSDLSVEKLPFPALIKPEKGTPNGENRKARRNPDQRFGYETQNFRFYSGPVSEPVYRNQSFSGTSWHLGLMASSREYLVIAINNATLKSEIRAFDMAFLTTIPVVILIVGFGGWMLSGVALKPVNKLKRSSMSIQSKDLHQRIPSEGEDHEFRDLIQVYNNMLERLQKSFEQANRFSSDAAHELTTPLAVLQVSIAQAMREAKDGSENQAMFSNLLEELQRLKSITQKLLLLSKADSGQLTLKRRQMNISEAVENLLYDIEVLAPELEVRHAIAENIVIIADSDHMKQVLQNLCSNAIKYNRPDGQIHLTLSNEKESIRFQIRNTVSSSANIDTSKIFDRFYRGDQSRSKEIDGVGLGLNLSSEIVTAHNGTIEVDESQKGWISFQVKLTIEMT